MGQSKKSSKIINALCHRKRVVIISMILVFSLYVGYITYLPADEGEFIKQAQAAFVRNNGTEIYVSDIAKFEWDRVCGVSKDAYFENEGKERKKLFLGENFEKAPNHWPKLKSFGYNWGLVFIREEMPVKVLSFNKWSQMRFGSDAFYIGYIDYPKNDSLKKSYSTSCFLKNEATLKINHHTGQLLLGRK